MRGIATTQEGRNLSDYLIAALIVISALVPMRLQFMGYTVGYYLPFVAFLGLVLSNARIEFKGLLNRKAPIVAAIVIAAVFLINGDTGDFYSFLFPRIMLLICGYVFVSNRDRLFALIETAVVFLAALGLLAIIESILSFNVFDALCNDYVQYEAANAFRFGLARARSVSTISLNFCTYMFFGSALALYRLAYANKRSFWIVCYALICAGAVFTLSRVPILLFIALNVVVAIQAGFIRNVERVILVAAAVMFIYLISVFLLPDSLGKVINSFFSMLGTVFSGTTSSMASLDSNLGDSTDRMMLYKMVPQLVAGHELFGLGTDTPFQYVQANGLLKESCENLYLYRYYTTGAVGLAGTLLFWLSFVVHGFAHMGNRAEWESGLRLSSIVPAVLVAYLLFGFDASFGDEYRIAFLFLGITCAHYWRFAQDARAKQEMKLGSKQKDSCNIKRGVHA